MEALKSYYEISPFFFIITMSASLLYTTMNISMFFGGDHADLPDHVPSDMSFKFFSTQTILAFFMGLGWAGITASVKWGLTFFQALPIAVAFGFLLMSFSAFLLFQIRKLNHEPVANLYSALGVKGSAYSEISAAAEGKVQIVVSGSLKIVSAVSAGDPIPSFTEVEVVGVRDKDTLIVRKISAHIPHGEPK